MNLPEISLQNTPKSQQDVEITYTEQELIDKLNCYQTNPAIVLSKLQINNATLKQAFSTGNF